MPLTESFILHRSNSDFAKAKKSQENLQKYDLDIGTSKRQTTHFSPQPVIPLACQRIINQPRLNPSIYHATSLPHFLILILDHPKPVLHHHHEKLTTHQGYPSSSMIIQILPTITTTNNHTHPGYVRPNMTKT